MEATDTKLAVIYHLNVVYNNYHIRKKRIIIHIKNECNRFLNYSQHYHLNSKPLHIFKYETEVYLDVNVNTEITTAAVWLMMRRLMTMFIDTFL